MRRVLVLVLASLALAAVLLLPRLTPRRPPPRVVGVLRLASPLDPVVAYGNDVEHRDGGTLGPWRFVATSAGLALHGADGRHRLTLNRTIGLASDDLVAACVWGDRIVAAAADGSLVVSDSTTTVAYRVATPITDVATLGDAVLLATPDRGLLRWTGGDEAFQISAPGDGAVSALAVGPSGAAVAMGRGEILLVGATESRPLAAPDEDPVLSLAWDGPALLVGRGERIDRLAADGDLVTWRGGASALAASSGLVYAARPDGGVVIFRPGEGGERATLTGVRIQRLRAITGGVLAFGSGGTWRIDETGVAERWVDAPAARLSAARVNALLVEQQALWVGNERGVDILEGAATRHLPLPPVQALVANLATREVIAVTSGGRLRIDREGRVRPDLGPAPILDEAPRAVTPGGLVTGDGGGLRLTDPLTGVTRRLHSPVPVGRVRALATDGDLLWVGTDEGVLGFRLVPLLAAPPES